MKEPISVPISPTVASAVVLIARLLAEPPAVPLTLPIVIALAIPVPTVRVTPLSSVVLPRVISPVEAPPTVTLVPDTWTAVPRLITPVPCALTLPSRITWNGAVATTPPTKFTAPELPSVTVPVLLKIVSPPMEFGDWAMLTL